VNINLQVESEVVNNAVILTTFMTEAIQALALNRQISHCVSMICLGITYSNPTEKAPIIHALSILETFNAMKGQD